MCIGFWIFYLMEIIGILQRCLRKIGFLTEIKEFTIRLFKNFELRLYRYANFFLLTFIFIKFNKFLFDCDKLQVWFFACFILSC